MKKRMTSKSSSWVPEGEVLTLRTSLLKTYLKCPAQAYFRYFKGLIVLPRSYTTMGTCTHLAAEHANKYKREKGKEAKLSVLQDVFHESWKEKAKATQFTKDEDPNDFDKEGVKKLIPTYHEKIHKRIEPLYVEEPFQIQIDSTLIVTGTIDLVETDNMIRDLKTKQRAPKWDEALKSFQGRSYRAGYKTKFKKEPEGFILDCLIRNREPEVITTKPVPYTDKDYQEFLVTVKQIATCIRLGIFYPQRENNYFCSPNSCGYWALCQRGEWRTILPYTQVHNRNQSSKQKEGKK